MDYTAHYDSPLGGITLGSDGNALIGLWFDAQKHYGSTLSIDHEERSLPVFDAAKRWLDLYFGGVVPDFTPPLVLRGSAFQRTVWLLLLAIPYGQTATYGELAVRVAAQCGRSHMSAQAVGGAIGRNAISLMIPCHRVVGSNGSLTGYAGGVERKLRLLTLENADVSRLFVPTLVTVL